MLREHTTYAPTRHPRPHPCRAPLLPSPPLTHTRTTHTRTHDTGSIYRDDVVFRDPRNCFCGLRNYKIIFWSLRFHGV